MKTRFEIKEVDRKFYQERLQDFLPAKIIDIHTHIWLRRFKKRSLPGPVRTVTWPARVARDNSIEDLMQTYRLMFPGKQITPMIFSTPQVGDNFEEANTYVSNCARKYNLPPLMLATPRWTAAELEDKISAGEFLGVKVYLSYADQNIGVS